MIPTCLCITEKTSTGKTLKKGLRAIAAKEWVKRKAEKEKAKAKL